MEGIEQTIQKKFRKLGEKEHFKYMWRLEADTIKQTEMKVKK